MGSFNGDGGTAIGVGFSASFGFSTFSRGAIGLSATTLTSSVWIRPHPQRLTKVKTERSVTLQRMNDPPLKAFGRHISLICRFFP